MDVTQKTRWGLVLRNADEPPYFDGQAASPGTLLANVMKAWNGPMTLIASNLGPSKFRVPNIMVVAGFMPDFQLS